MVGSTAVFVNTLNPGEVPDGSTTSSIDTGDNGPTGSSTTSTSSTTTTTLAADVQAYLAAIDGLAATGTDLVDRATTINQQWDDRAITFGEAVELMEALSRDASQFSADVELATPTIPRLEPAHLDVTTAARAMSEAGVGMLTGLQDPNSSSGRRDSLAAFLTFGSQLQDAIDVVRVTAGAPVGAAGTTSTTEPLITDEPGLDE